MLNAMDNDAKESSSKYDSSGFSVLRFLLEFLAKHAGDMVSGVLALLGTFEKDVRMFVMRLVRDLVIGAAFLFVGSGFIVFGLGTMIIRWLHIDMALGSLLIGTVFVLIGMVVFLVSRRK